MPTAQARLTLVNAWPACDQKQYPVRPSYELAARAKSRVQILLFPVASCAHVPPAKFQDSDLRRPMVAGHYVLKAKMFFYFVVSLLYK